MVVGNLLVDPGRGCMADRADGAGEYFCAAPVPCAAGGPTRKHRLRRAMGRPLGRRRADVRAGHTVPGDRPGICDCAGVVHGVRDIGASNIPWGDGNDHARALRADHISGRTAVSDCGGGEWDGGLLQGTRGDPGGKG